MQQLNNIIEQIKYFASATTSENRFVVAQDMIDRLFISNYFSVDDMTNLIKNELTSIFNVSNIKESEEKESNIVKSLNILKGNGTEDQVNTICINAALFLLLAKKAESLEQGYRMAKGIASTDKVWNLFLNVVEAYGGNRDNIYNLMERSDSAV